MISNELDEEAMKNKMRKVQDVATGEIFHIHINDLKAVGQKYKPTNLEIATVTVKAVISNDEKITTNLEDTLTMLTEDILDIVDRKLNER